MCPGCLLANWHPHCLATVYYDDGVPVDTDWMPEAEMDPSMLRWCDYIDEVLIVDPDQPAPWPAWKCPACGTEYPGGEYEVVHADYPQSRLAGNR